MEPEERLAQKWCIAVSSPDVAEEADDHYWRQVVKQWARVCGHVSAAGYDIEVTDSDGLRRAMSQVKWPTPNSSGSTAIDLIHGPAADLLWLAVTNLPFYIAIEPLLSFLKDTFCDAGLGSTASKSDLIDGPRGGHPLRLFQGETTHLLFQGESARLRHQGGHPTAVLFQGEGAHLRQHGAHPGSVLFPRNEPICDK